MSKTLKVIKPFYVMEVGDTFKLSQDGKTYVCSSELKEGNDNGSFFEHSSSFTISTDYASSLIEEGYLSEEIEDKPKYSFVNVFDEIKNMMDEYNDELLTLDDDMAEHPACLKVEKQTVLTNLVTVLNHLYSLKKN